MLHEMERQPQNAEAVAMLRNITIMIHVMRGVQRCVERKERAMDINQSFEVLLSYHRIPGRLKDCPNQNLPLYKWAVLQPAKTLMVSDSGRPQNRFMHQLVIYPKKPGDIRAGCRKYE